MRARGGVAVLFASVVAACGTLLGVSGEEPAPPPGPAPAPDAEAGVDAAPEVDAGADAPFDADDGGLAPPEAGSIACGDRACEAIQQFCCYDAGVPACSMNVNADCAFELYCDQPADCISGERCVLLAGSPRSGCAALSPDDAGYLCGDDGDCPGTKCVVKTCRGVRMRLCDGYCPP